MIHVLGSGGMLGNYVFRFLSMKHECVGHTRHSFDVVRDIVYLGKLGLHTGDIVVNCIGVIKPQIETTGELDSFLVNGFFPRILADYCESLGCTMFHVTTDCVYDGGLGAYTEDDEATQLDTYGLSKRLGEPENCCVIRTSIIGEEAVTSRSLIEWVKSQRDGEVFGFTNHHWNGITCLQFAKCIDKLVQSNHNWRGVRHVFTPDRYTKYQMLEMISEVFDLNLTINEKEADLYCDRTLNSIHLTSSFLDIPPLKQQIAEMKEFSGYGCD